MYFLVQRTKKVASISCLFSPTYFYPNIYFSSTKSTKNSSKLKLVIKYSLPFHLTIRSVPIITSTEPKSCSLGLNKNQTFPIKPEILHPATVILRLYSLQKQKIHAKILNSEPCFHAIVGTKNKPEIENCFRKKQVTILVAGILTEVWIFSDILYWSNNCLP